MSSNEVDATPLSELAAAITSGAVRLAAATAAWLRLVAEFDARGGWHGVGILSCAHWLAWQCGMGPGAAREHVRVARALRGLPRIEAAFIAGRLSYSKVRALTRVAEPDSEAALVDFALSATASQTERFCRSWRRVDDTAAAGGREQAELDQSFEHWTDDDGWLTLKIRMRAEAGVPLISAVESRAETEARRERAQAKKARLGHEATRAAGGRVDPELEDRCADDASVGLARERIAARRIAALTALVDEGAAAGRRRPGDPPRREVVVHVDADVLADDTAAGRAYYEGGPAITGAQARRMLCEATVVAMIERGREPLAVGRRKRRATRAQLRALLRRDGGCARSGCPETRIERLHAHHLRHWLFGGATDIDNLVLLCDVDHGLVHDLDLVTTRRAGTLVATTPEGVRVWGAADAAFPGGLDGAAPDPDRADDPYAGVQPIDTTAGRRPTAASAPPSRRDAPRPPADRRHRRLAARHGRPRPAGPGRSGGPGRRGARRVRPEHRSAVAARAVDVVRETRRLGEALFPDGPPVLAAPGEAPCERLDMRYAIGVLMGNRDLVRRLVTDAGTRSAEGRDVPAGTSTEPR
ncbi:hypothetical protein DQ244_07720 [Blastococcus sp. TBT05-19]|uniref:HNH endonuclease signature motif containing protein n=1 Tax=Blastococcus sp. TBT05-19 TaxID=2250581 RepID=UPI000DE8D222|nr:HNH endonuclease signature motif containing protein [Blastococcus sp. TBT05-19]RBY92179.1 hypothetical protein DQ244_07720 [Blastococcus sp. TBT05-19]